MIEVILLEKIGRLGGIGQTVKVKPGYARNFLLPRKKALRATKDNLAYFEAQRHEIEAANANAKEKAESYAKKMDGKKFVIIRQASEVGQLFGSVTMRDVATLLHDAGYEIERQSVNIPAPIKMLGLHKVEVQLHADVAAVIVLNIARTEDEAKVQEKTGAAVKAAADKAALAEVEAAKKLEEANRALFETPAAAPEAEEKKE
jgi:large subunit ribosomal protein L9